MRLKPLLALVAVGALVAVPASAAAPLEITTVESTPPESPFSYIAQYAEDDAQGALIVMASNRVVESLDVLSSSVFCNTGRSRNLTYVRCDLVDGRADVQLSVTPNRRATRDGQVLIRSAVYSSTPKHLCLDCSDDTSIEEKAMIEVAEQISRPPTTTPSTTSTTTTPSTTSTTATTPSVPNLPNQVTTTHAVPTTAPSTTQAPTTTEPTIPVETTIDTTTTVVAPTTASTIADVAVGDTLVEQGRMSAQDWSQFAGLPVDDLEWTYDTGGASVIAGPVGPELRVAHQPGSNSSGTGTPINQAVWKLPAQRTYTLTQEVLLEPGWQWGPSDQTNNQLGKIGGGFLGGSYPSGGIVDPAGFSARPMWLYGSELSAYTYEATRSERYGHQNPSGASLPVGRWFTIRMTVTANSDIAKSDGSIQLWLDGDLVLDRQDVQWQTEGDIPMITRYTHVSFHGGSGQQYAPDTTVYARYRNISIG